MGGEVAAILVLAGVHVLGVLVLVGHIGRDMLDLFRLDGEDGGDGGEPRDDAPVPTRPGGGGDLPLPGAAQAPVRLREPGRIGDHYPRPARRPDHEPERVPVP